LALIDITIVCRLYAFFLSHASFIHYLPTFRLFRRFFFVCRHAIFTPFCLLICRYASFALRSFRFCWHLLPRRLITPPAPSFFLFDHARIATPSERGTLPRCFYCCLLIFFLHCFYYFAVRHFSVLYWYCFHFISAIAIIAFALLFTSKRILVFLVIFAAIGFVSPLLLPLRCYICYAMPCLRHYYFALSPDIASSLLMPCRFIRYTRW